MAIGNSVNDEIREQHNKMKGKSFKEKFGYFWEYYKVHTIVAILLIICVSNFIYTQVTKKDIVLEVAFVNTMLSGDDKAVEQLDYDITSMLGYDPAKYETVLNTNMMVTYDGMDQFSAVNMQKLVAMTSANSLDIFLADDVYIDHNYQAGMFADLSEMLPADVLSQYEDRLLYRDIEEDGKGEVPVAIDVSGSGLWITPEAPAWFALAANTVKSADAAKFLEYIMAQ